MGWGPVMAYRYLRELTTQETARIALKHNGWTQSDLIAGQYIILTLGSREVGVYRIGKQYRALPVVDEYHREEGFPLHRETRMGSLPQRELLDWWYETWMTSEVSVPAAVALRASVP